METKQNIPRNPRRRSPYQRNRRLQAEMLSIVLLAVVVAFLVLGLLIPDKDFSESENRSLAKLPALSETFFADMGNYVADQFPGRDLWMSVNLALNKALGQKEASGVYLCEDDYLMQIPAEPNYEQAERNLAAINAFAEMYPDLNMVMCVAPNAVTVLDNKLPENAPVRDQKADLAYIAEGLDTVPFVDVTKTLRHHRSEYLFYKTDHHWTSLAAAYAFEDIAPMLNIEAPALQNYTVYTVSTAFEGTLSSKSGSHTAKDTVEIYVPDTNIEYYVQYPTGDPISSFYNRAALDQKDHYTVFFGGNYPRVDITTSANTHRCLLLFKDSYANCMVQFLYPYFDHITMIDPRYYYDNLELVIKSEAVTDVLFLYNADTYLGDTSLADVLTIEQGE